MDTKKILIVEDEKDILNLECRILEAQGYEILTATTALEALGIVKATHLDLIITDIMMPGMDGLELIKTIRFTDEYSKRAGNVPVIIVTAKTHPRDLAEGFASGAVVYLTKPFSRETLLTAVKTLFVMAGDSPEPEVGEKQVEKEINFLKDEEKKAPQGEKRAPPPPPPPIQATPKKVK